MFCSATKLSDSSRCLRPDHAVNFFALSSSIAPPDNPAVASYVAQRPTARWEKLQFRGGERLNRALDLKKLVCLWIYLVVRLHIHPAVQSLKRKDMPTCSEYTRILIQIDVRELLATKIVDYLAQVLSEAAVLAEFSGGEPLAAYSWALAATAQLRVTSVRYWQEDARYRATSCVLAERDIALLLSAWSTRFPTSLGPSRGRRYSCRP